MIHIYTQTYSTIYIFNNNNKEGTKFESKMKLIQLVVIAFIVCYNHANAQSCRVPGHGVDFSGEGGTLTIPGFNPTGLVCATGYCGTVSETACTANNGVYNVSGCAPCVCTTPTNAAYNFTNEHADCLIGTGNAATCAASLACASGYSGTITTTYFNIFYFKLFG